MIFSLVCLFLIIRFCNYSQNSFLFRKALERLRSVFVVRMLQENFPITVPDLNLKPTGETGVKAKVKKVFALNLAYLFYDNVHYMYQNLIVQH